MTSESSTMTRADALDAKFTGNRTISPAQQTAETPTGFQSSNRVSGWYYDFAGNVVGIPVAGATTTRASCVGAILPAVPTNVGMLRTSCYDGEGHMVSETDSTGKTSTYEYDGQGRRVRKTVGTVTTTYVYDAAGQLAAEYGGEVPADSGTRYLFTDHLGSTRLTAKGDGTDPKPLDYYPFGEEVTASGTPQVYPSGAAATALDVKFTGKLRDAESGLDFFEARYYSSVQGRFTSPDEWAGGMVDAFTGGQVGTPGPLPYADITDPQTINKYVYVRNNPLRYTDPDGHVFETLWDVANVGMDLYSLGSNLYHGNFGSAAVDAGGLALDAVATVIPFVPGGAGATIKAARAADNLVDGVQSLKRADNIADNAKAGKTFDQARKEGFQQAGMTDPTGVKFTKVDLKTGTVVEFKGADGAKVAYDTPHKKPGPGHESPHVGYQTGGKRTKAGRKRGNIPYTGPQHPSRSPIKGEGDVEPH